MCKSCLLSDAGKVSIIAEQVSRKQEYNIHFGKGKTFFVDNLYDRYCDELVLWADTILNDVGEAEDLVQDF